MSAPGEIILFPSNSADAPSGIPSPHFNALEVECWNRLSALGPAEGFTRMDVPMLELASMAWATAIQPTATLQERKFCLECFAELQVTVPAPWIRSKRRIPQR